MARPGKLDQRVTFQAYTITSDGGGGQTKTWADIASAPTVWAHVRSGSGKEQFEEDRTNATGMTVFVIRNRSDIDERMRIVWGGDNHNIRHIARAGSREMYLTITAERGVSN